MVWWTVCIPTPKQNKSNMSYCESWLTYSDMQGNQIENPSHGAGYQEGRGIKAEG